MRFLAVTAIAAVLILSIVPQSHAQDPRIAIYFDPAFTQTSADCPGAGQLASLYIVAEDFGALIQGIEFKLELPPSMTWLADLGLPPVTIGSTVNGVSMGFPLPINAFGQVQVAEVLFLWNCSDCSATNQRARIVEHPIFDSIRAARWPDALFIDARGVGATVCPDVRIDIQPERCPNTISLHQLLHPSGNGNGNSMHRKGPHVSVALVGTSTFDINDVDLSSLRLEGVSAFQTRVKDVAVPENTDCACDGGNGRQKDGVKDVWLKFKSAEIGDALGTPTAGHIDLTLTGTLLDGTPFSASECITIDGRDNGATPKELGAGGMQLALEPASPNPFNPVTTLRFSVPTSQRARLAIYDVAGRLVELLVDEVVPAGTHSFVWEARGVASGVYFYKLTTAEGVEVKRMTLLK